MAKVKKDTTKVVAKSGRIIKKFIDGFGTIIIYLNDNDLLESIKVIPIIKSAVIELTLKNTAWKIVREVYESKENK